LAEAGRTLADIGLVQVYDAFTILPIVLLENVGLAEPGRGGELYLDGHTMPGGRLPTNTQGGGLAHCHPGFYGIFLVIEAVRQLRGEAGERQVPDPRVALTQGAGGGAFGGSQATLILDAA
jgi:acetyl-CoA acetyltransferase